MGLDSLEVAYIIAHSKPAICFAHPDLIRATKEACYDLGLARDLQSSLQDLD
jgi:hypothetical protein